MELLRDSIYQFKIALKRPSPKIWRRIQVPKSLNFFAFHMTIQNSMGWKNCHFHQFEQFTRFLGSNVVIGFEDDGEFFGPKTLCGKKCLIRDYFVNPGDKGLYLYDLAVNWDHKVKLEMILDAEPDVQYPKCIAGARACPPEEVGGLKGFKKHLKIVKNPRHKRYEEHLNFLEEVGGCLNPDEFDPEKVVFVSIEEY